MERCNDTHGKSTKSSRSKKHRRSETWEHRQERENSTSLCMEREVTPYLYDMINNISRRSVYPIGEIASLDMICVEEESPRTKEVSTSPEHRIKRKKRKSKYTPKIDIFLCDDEEETTVEETVNKLCYQTEKPMETERTLIPRKRKHKKRYQENLDQEKSAQASQGERKRKGGSRSKLESASVNPPSEYVDQESGDKTGDIIIENEKVRHHHRRASSRLAERKESADRPDDFQKKKVRSRSSCVPSGESDDRKDNNLLEKVRHDRDGTKECRESEDMMDGIQKKVRKRSRTSTTNGEEDIKKKRKHGEPRIRKRIKKDKQADADQEPHEICKREEKEVLTTSDIVEFPHRRSRSSKRGQSKKTKFEDVEYEEEKPKVRRAKKGKKPIVDADAGATKDLRLRYKD